MKFLVLFLISAQSAAFVPVLVSRAPAMPSRPAMRVLRDTTCVPCPRRAPVSCTHVTMAEGEDKITWGTYTYGNFKCAFKTKAAAPGREGDAPLLLVHPVGIGLSSWFWDKFLDEWQGGQVFAADLIGCGKSDPFIPEEEGMFVPLDWVRALERLWDQEIKRPCVVVVQGGLAPVGVQMAARTTSTWDGSRSVCGLVLASPPSFDAMRLGLDSSEVAKNWKWLTSRVGQLSYYLLRGRLFVKFFSDFFLFAGGSADAAWLEAACEGATEDAKWPVFAFNSGLVIAKGFADELDALCERAHPPLLVLSGSEDARTQKREASAARIFPACQLVRIKGKNILPWESPREVAAALLEFSSNSVALQ